jgi:hypothetical protein
LGEWGEGLLGETGGVAAPALRREEMREAEVFIAEMRIGYVERRRGAKREDMKKVRREGARRKPRASPERRGRGEECARSSGTG